ncbi:hypothetical protein EDF56_104109 [Novosphingobium sp. PhB165]|nr:hypothetical protein [Novosphingobium sp. PhB165]TCM18579.1 hypothetical protein EDF56_104109 [Novosphingobium sp. PhB165]
MARVLTLTQNAAAIPQAEWLRMTVVSGCALALILAKTALPF